MYVPHWETHVYIHTYRDESEPSDKSMCGWMDRVRKLTDSILLTYSIFYVQF